MNIFKRMTMNKTEQLNHDIASGKYDTDKISDGYHTFENLYSMRLAYNAALFNQWASIGKYDVHKSRRHHDGEACFGGGWFIVTANLPTGQISNHYEAKYWDLFHIPAEERAQFEFDNHTEVDVIERLITL